MRVWMVAGMMMAAFGAVAQDGAHVATLAKVKGHRAAWVGTFVRVENVTISNFTRAKGALASDATGSIRIDDIGLSLQMIGHLERHCAGAPSGQGRAECHGALEFTMVEAEASREGLVISDVNFIPEL